MSFTDINVVNTNIIINQIGIEEGTLNSIKAADEKPTKIEATSLSTYVNQQNITTMKVIFDIYKINSLGDIQF